MKESAVINRGIQISTYFFNVLLLFCLLIADQKHKGNIWYNTLKRVISIYPILAKVSLVLTTIVLYLNLLSNLPALFLTIIISMVSTIIMGNYHLKKE